MLAWHPKDRATAKEMLEHEWLIGADKLPPEGSPDYDSKMTEQEFKEYSMQQNIL